MGSQRSEVGEEEDKRIRGEVEIWNIGVMLLNIFTPNILGESSPLQVVFFNDITRE